MNNRTPEQVAADDKLTAAVREAAQAYGVLSGAMMIDFMIIVEGIQDDGDDEEHGILFQDNRTRTTVAYGLLEKGSQMLQMSDLSDMDDGD